MVHVMSKILLTKKDSYLGGLNIIDVKNFSNISSAPQRKLLNTFSIYDSIYARFCWSLALCSLH